LDLSPLDKPTNREIVFIEQLLFTVTVQEIEIDIYFSSTDGYSRYTKSIRY